MSNLAVKDEIEGYLMKIKEDEIESNQNSNFSSACKMRGVNDYLGHIISKKITLTDIRSMIHAS